MAIAEGTPTTVPMDEGAAPQAVVLSGNYYGQPPNSELCWAACTQMILDHCQQPVPSLCELDQAVCGKPCCQGDVSGECDQPHWPEDIYPHCHVGYLPLDTALSLGNVVYEINQGRPVQALLKWLDSDGDVLGMHVLLICGVDSKGRVLVRDPLYGEGWLPFDYVRNAYNCGVWSRSYYYLRAPV